MNKKIYIIGTGMNAKKTITVQGLAVVNNADILIGARRMTEFFADLGKPVFVSYDSEIITEYIKKSSYEIYAVLMSGDCGFYSGAEKLKELLDDTNTEIICGVSAPVYFSSSIGIPWLDWHFVSLHGMNANIIRSVCSYEKTFFLLGGKITASQICSLLCEYGMSNVSVYIGENLGYDNEKISEGYAENFKDKQTEKLSVILIINSDYERLKKIGIPDSEFIRGNVPMTKCEIRSVCISKLQIRENDICWDIGGGSGSVSVEMAIQCTNGKVYSVDKSEEAISLIEQNRHKFGCDNIIPVHSDALGILKSLPVPDKVFIGGSDGYLTEIVKIVYQKNSKTAIIITAVSLETLHESSAVLNEYGIEAEITQISISRTKKIGTHTMLEAENPIFIIRGIGK